MWKQRERWKSEIWWVRPGIWIMLTLQNLWWILPKYLHSMCQKTKMLRIHKQPSGDAICFQRDCRACGLVCWAGWWSVNEAVTPSLCIQLIHLIKGVRVGLASRSGAVDLYLKYSRLKTPLQLPCKWAKAMKRRGAWLVLILWWKNGDGEMRTMKLNDDHVQTFANFTEFDSEFLH